METEEQARQRRARVLVTDGEQRAALAVVRSLGKEGHTVFVQSAAHSLSGDSRYAARELIVPSADTQPDGFARSIAEAVRAHEIDFVIPITDAALQCLLPARSSLVPAVIPFGDERSYALLSDKGALIEHARQFGIAVPTQRNVASREDLASAADALRFPLVLKPSCSVRAQGGRLCKLNVVYANDRPALERHVAELDDSAFPLLLQERIVGPGMGALFLMWDGKARARFAHRRLRERPPSGGEMVYATSIPLDSDVAARCEAMLSAAGWRGPAMVEFKIHHETGELYLMEVNARFWGSLQLAIDSGVDFPALLIDAALGSAHDDVPEYRVGTRMRWFWGDVDHLVVRFLHSCTRLNMADGWTGRVGALSAFAATTLRGERDAVFRWDDPRPFVRETRDWMSYHVRRFVSLPRALRNA